jgi:TonB family protein
MFEALVVSGPRPRSVPHRYALSAGIHAMALVGAVALTRQPLRAPVKSSEPTLIPFTVAEKLPAPPAGPIVPPPLSNGAPATVWSPLALPDIGSGMDDLGLPTVGDILDRVTGGDGALAPAERFAGTGRVTDAPGAETVDEPVAVLHQPAPRYPAALASAGVDGRVELEYVIDTLGRVEPGSLRTIGSPHPALADAARESVLASRYRPARLRGAAVRQLVRQAIVFRVEADGRPN